MKQIFIMMTALLLAGCAPDDDDTASDSGVPDTAATDARDVTATGDVGEDLTDAEDDADDDATDSPLPPAARGPCTTADDCMLSQQCACPEPMLAGENPAACHAYPPDGSSYFCIDTFGAEQVTDPLTLVCHDKQCHTFAGHFCEVYENSPNAGVDVLKNPFMKSCATAADCEIATRMNPCGCEEAVSNIGGSDNPAAYWTSDVMESVWNAAELQCGDRGECDCPPSPSGVTCNQDGRCELVP